MVFMPAVSNFVIPSLLGGGKYMLVGNLIEQQFTTIGNWNFRFCFINLYDDININFNGLYV